MYDHNNLSKGGVKGGDSSEDEDNLDDAAVDINSPVKSKPKSSNNTTQSEKDDSDYSDNSVVEVPDDFIFTGYMAFMLWGPFSPPESKLILFDNQDAPKNDGAIGRAAKRKLDIEPKELDHVSDANANCGFSTDQRITIEGLFVQKQIQK